MIIYVLITPTNSFFNEHGTQGHKANTTAGHKVSPDLTSPSQIYQAGLASKGFANSGYFT